MIHDVIEADFEKDVIERSLEVPVIVDFWAEWCGPCRQIGPVLERAVERRAGKVDLAKVDTDTNQSISRAFEIQGIPAVKAFRNRVVVDEFVGAIPPARIEQFVDRLVPSEADELAGAGDEASLRAALELDPRHADAAIALARILIGREQLDQAAALVEGQRGDFIADGLAGRIELARANGTGPDLGAAFAYWDGGNSAAALDQLQDAIAATEDPAVRDAIRRVMVAIFTELGPGDPLARAHRQRLAAVLI